MRRGRDRTIVGLSLGVLALSGVALALDPGGYPPGYQWGLQNCGPHVNPQIRSLESCRACCLAEYNANWHTQTWLDQCYSYCDVVNWDNW